MNGIEQIISKNKIDLLSTYSESFCIILAILGFKN